MNDESSMRSWNGKARFNREYTLIGELRSFVDLILYNIRNGKRAAEGRQQWPHFGDHSERPQA